jgi:hypothetical protein
MTNREIARSLFVTPKAVQWHLRNVYLKLDISARAGLRDALETAEGPDDDEPMDGDVDAYAAGRDGDS